MILHDYECQTCGVVEEHFSSSENNTVRCNECGDTAERIYLTLAKPHWAALAQGDNASPEAINRFEKNHKQQKAKEEKSYREHGDYGPAPGGRGGSRPVEDNSN